MLSWLLHLGKKKYGVLVEGAEGAVEDLVMDPWDLSTPQ
jgi:hypothetical protein